MAYQFVARLNFVRESWTGPVDVLRVRPTEDANTVATKQLKALLGRLGREEADPLFVFDAGYDPVKLQQGLEGWPCQILVRLRAGRHFYAEPSFAGPPAHTGRPRRHGPKMKCKDPSTWPKPLPPVPIFIALNSRATSASRSGSKVGSLRRLRRVPWAFLSE